MDSKSRIICASVEVSRNQKGNGMRRIAMTLLSAAALIAVVPGIAVAENVTVTISGTYLYTGNAPSPTPNFSLSFELDRSPGVCGGSEGAFLACAPSAGHYTNGTLDTMIGTASPPWVLFADTGHGGGVSFFQNDLPLNRLSFIIGSSQLFSGTLANPTLVDGVYSILPNPPCDPQQGCHYVSYAGQGFAVGDPINNPFYDPISLQSYDPLTAGTITISATLAPVPEPESYAMLLSGLGILSFAARRRKHKAA